MILLPLSAKTKLYFSHVLITITTTQETWQWAGLKSQELSEHAVTTNYSRAPDKFSQNLLIFCNTLLKSLHLKYQYIYIL